MSDEINQQRQCQTCSVCFLTNDELRDHLDGYRSQERLLSAKLEQCRAHSSQLDGEHDTSYDAHDDNGHVDGDVHDSTFLRNDKPADQLCCPHEECDRNIPFAKRQKLVRHFAKHVRCIEVCVYCYEVFTLASQYIAHADTHRDADMTKNSYTRQICDRLRQNVAESLDDCQLKGVQTKKRTRELAGTPGARRVKAKLDVEPANNQVADSGQSHLDTNHQDHHFPSSPLPTNDQARDPLSDISLNATKILPRGTDSLHNMQHVDRDSTCAHPRLSSSLVTGESISDTLRLGRTGISAISALLNHDSNTPATALATTQDPLQGSKDGPVSIVTGQQSLDKAAAVPIPQQSDVASAAVVPTLLKAIQIEKHTLHQIVLKRPNDILGGIWFGSLRGYPPFVSLRLRRALDIIVKPSGLEVYVSEPSTGASSTVTGVHLIKLGVFRQMIQRDGFGEIFWNECGEEAYVTMVVTDERLVADFLQGAVTD